MYEVDFLAIEKTDELGSRSGDAISVRFTEEATGVERVMVIDGGFSHTGERMVEHIRTWYETDRVDLMISTHPDQDHINGLATVMDELTVGELLLHRPHDHADDVSDFSNIEVVDALIGLADDKGVTVTEPFTGLSRFNDQLLVLGPTETYYEELVAQHLFEEETGRAAARRSAATASGGLLAKAGRLLERALSALPIETLSEDGETGPRNNTSVVTLLTVEDERMVFTGDAGIPALNAAWDEYEHRIGHFPDALVNFFQAPHHGSKRNLSPSLLNRMFGKPGDSPAAPTSFISSAKNDPDHPSPKVTNALQRRGFRVYATEGKTICHHSADAPSRLGWTELTSLPPLDEDDEDD